MTRWGGEDDSGAWVKYRQVRAVEIQSLCRATNSRYVADHTLRVTVNCDNPRH